MGLPGEAHSEAGNGAACHPDPGSSSRSVFFRMGTSVSTWASEARGWPGMTAAPEAPENLPHPQPHQPRSALGDESEIPATGGRLRTLTMTKRPRTSGKPT